eukprot:Awhi_evm2s15284
MSIGNAYKSDVVFCSANDACVEWSDFSTDNRFSNAFPGGSRVVRRFIKWNFWAVTR